MGNASKLIGTVFRLSTHNLYTVLDKNVLKLNWRIVNKGFIVKRRFNVIARCRLNLAFSAVK
jgi:RNA-binding protein YlmH